MADVLNAGNLFPQTLVTDMFSKVKGHSSLARLSTAAPIPFNGLKEFTFSLDKEIDVVAESGAKSKGGSTATPVTIVPVKVEYSARISDEFVKASDEVKLNYLTAFSDGFAKKVAKGIDIMAMHGFNPRTGTASTVIGTNHFDSAVSQIVTESAGVTADANIESAIALVQGSDCDVNGMAMSNTLKAALAALTTTDGKKLYPELAWGNQPSMINGLPVDSNSTVNFNSSLDRGIVGDFANAFKWRYAGDVSFEVIQYGNPDNDATLGDLKGHNQVLLRSEAYIGWAILDPNAFAIIKAA